MRKLGFIKTECISFKLTKRFKDYIDNKIKAGLYHSRGDYLRDLIRKDNLK